MQAFMAKTKRSVFVLAAAVLLLGLAAGLNLRGSKAQAQANGGGTQYFLKIDGIQGESTDKAHAGEIELDSFAWAKDESGIEQTTVPGGGGGGAGKPQVREIHFAQQVSKASPKLMEAAATGKHFKEAVLSVRKSGKAKQQDYVVIKLSDVQVSSYRVTGNDPSAPQDEFELRFATLQYAYHPQKADGSAGAPIIGEIDARDDR